MLRRQLFLLVLSALFIAPLSHAQTEEVDALDRVRRLPPLEMDEVLWLARCIYSESDRAEEQHLVAWVVRNRVDTQYRGSTYRHVVLEPRQFSAFNTPTSRRNHILGLNQYSEELAWKSAVDIALEVYQANHLERPFSQDTRHFYSPVSMKGGATPPWATQAQPLPSDVLETDPERFLFFENIDESLDPIPPQKIKPGTYIASKTTDIRSKVSRLRGRRPQFSSTIARPYRPTSRRPRKVARK